MIGQRNLISSGTSTNNHVRVELGQLLAKRSTGHPYIPLTSAITVKSAASLTVVKKVSSRTSIVAPVKSTPSSKKLKSQVQVPKSLPLNFVNSDKKNPQVQSVSSNVTSSRNTNSKDSVSKSELSLPKRTSESLHGISVKSESLKQLNKVISRKSSDLLKIKSASLPRGSNDALQKSSKIIKKATDISRKASKTRALKTGSRTAIVRQQQQQESNHGDEELNSNRNQVSSRSSGDEGTATEKMSKDIAKAVAMIVAEYEMLRKKDPSIVAATEESEPEKEPEKKEEHDLKKSETITLTAAAPDDIAVINKNIDPNITANANAILSIVSNSNNVSKEPEVKGKSNENANVAATENVEPTPPIQQQPQQPRPISPNNNSASAKISSSQPRMGEFESELLSKTVSSVVPAGSTTTAAAGEQQQKQTQSSTLPAKVKADEEIKKVNSGTGKESKESQSQTLKVKKKKSSTKKKSTVPNKESDVTIALEFKPAARTGPPRCSVPAPNPSKEARVGVQSEVKRHLSRVQNYINALGYHREGEPEASINVRLSMKTHMITAKQLISAGRPIKCLHAVILGVYLTNGLDTVERFPIYFRSHVADREYKHIVLGIYCQSHFGALGISRDTGLQDKKLIYTKLSDLIFEFTQCYHSSGHILNEVKLGNIITRDTSSLEKIFSKIGTIPIHNHTKADIEANVEKVAKQLRTRMGMACLKSTYFDSTNTKNFTQAPTLRKSRSRSSIVSNVAVHDSFAYNNTGVSHGMRPRALSLGPSATSSTAPLLRNKVEEKSSTVSKNISKTSTRAKTSKPPKTKRKNSMTKNS